MMLLCFVICPVFTPRAFFLSSSVAGTHSWRSCRCRCTLTALLSFKFRSSLHRHTLTVSTLLVTRIDPVHSHRPLCAPAHSHGVFFLSLTRLSIQSTASSSLFVRVDPVYSHGFFFTRSSCTCTGTLSRCQRGAHSLVLSFFNRHEADPFLGFNRHQADCFFALVLITQCGTLAGDNF